MSYQEIGHEHLEKLDDAHILLFHEILFLTKEDKIEKFTFA